MNETRKITRFMVNRQPHNERLPNIMGYLELGYTLELPAGGLMREHVLRLKVPEGLDEHKALQFEQLQHELADAFLHLQEGEIMNIYDTLWMIAKGNEEL